MTIKPIETSYGGWRFRSCLEARWAIFFEHLKIDFEYEAQGYVVNGKPYLPDFKLTLPTGRVMFAEIKGSEVDDHKGVPVELCRGLADLTRRPTPLLNGLPTYRLYHLFLPDFSRTSLHAVFFTSSEPFVRAADNYWFQLVELDESTGRLNFPFSERRARKAFGRNLVEAVYAARSARFEHGESGA